MTASVKAVGLGMIAVIGLSALGGYAIGFGFGSTVNDHDPDVTHTPPDSKLVVLPCDEEAERLDVTGALNCYLEVEVIPCPVEDSEANCYWDAATQGNGEGRSFIHLYGNTYYLSEG